MEKKKEISIEKLEAAAKALGITVETIKDFNERVMFNNNIALEENSGQVIHPIKEVIDYFKEELAKRDATIEALRTEVEDYRAGRKKPAKSKNVSSKGLHSVTGRKTAP